MTRALGALSAERRRWLVGATLAAVIALCWGWIAPMALDMYGPMTGCSAWMMTRTWDFAHQAPRQGPPVITNNDDANNWVRRTFRKGWELKA